MKLVLLLLFLTISSCSLKNIKNRSKFNDSKCTKGQDISKISKKYVINEVLYISTLPNKAHNGHGAIY